ncbi:MAG: RHS repeat-associated core domain-containing protein, partial [Bacteroidota bacterium]
GRQTARKHPDANLTEFVYDLAGNPTKKITANIRTQIPDGGAILYTYDKERLVQIDYPRNYQNQVRFHYGGADAQYGRVGRVWLTEDASGGEEVYYDELGQVSKQVRTLVISPEKQLTYVSEFVYDTWGRIQQMIYPDGEVVDYEYSGAGKLIAVSSQKEGERYDIVRRLGYDKFEERIYMEFGNGTKTSYVYQPERRRLKQLEVFTPGAGGRTIMDYRYQYDAVDNILSVQNSVSIPSVFQLGGPTQHHFEYDELYRLTKALGSWKGKNDARSYQLEMIYNNQHNILQKDQVHLRQGQDTVGKNTYRNTYLYEGNQPHAPSQVGVKKMHYDANGNLIRWEIPKLFHKREIQWDEENRIQGIIDNGALSKFTYNAAGERAIKSHGGLQAAFYNGETSGFQRHSSNWTAYVSPYLVATNKGFTKHYFIEGQRIQAKIGKGEFKNQFSLLAPNTAGGINYGAKLAEQEAQAGAYYDSLYRLTAFPEIIAVKGQPAFTGRPIPPLNPQAHYELPQAWQDLWRARTNQDPPGLPALGDPVNDNSNLKAGFNYQPDSVSLESDLYFLHGDHLGSASFITDASGLVTQHIGYLPFGETFYEEHNARLAHSYLFNGKELDRETGLYYSGARYVDPESSLWLGVDPLADIMSNWSPYCYTFNNPVNFTDPTGKIPSPTEGAAMSDHIYTGKAGEEVVGGWTLDRVLSSESDPGYRAGVYVRERNGIKEYAMANAGTEFSITKKSGRDDLVENIEQPFGGSEHMKLSISHAKELSREVGNAELTFVGHSKGGAEAAGNALATNRNALLYNPAAINPNAYGLDSKLYTGADEHGMTAFIVKGDALNRYLNSWSARPIDKAVYLNRQSLSSVKNHSIKSVINALKNHSP